MTSHMVMEYDTAPEGKDNRKPPAPKGDVDSKCTAPEDDMDRKSTAPNGGDADCYMIHIPTALEN